MIRFGPSGNSEKFYEEGFKSSVDMPKWLNLKGLNAYEYQCSKGVNISEKTAREIGENAKEHGIALSVHAPYYINLSSNEEKIKISSSRHMIDSLKVAGYLNAKRVVFHPGSLGKGSREDALANSKILLKQIIDEADSNDLLVNTHLCPELMGKTNQLGSLFEIMEICKLDERLLPTIDFGHLNARGQGCLKSEEDYMPVLDEIENNLGFERLKIMHIHFSKVEFSAGGEKKHLNFDNTEYGPEFLPFAKAMLKKKIEPVIICESTDNMVEDALYMKGVYEELLGGLR